MATQEQADYFANTFNRLVGRHTGRLAKSRPASSVRKEGGRYGGRRAAAAIQHGTVKAPSGTKKQLEATFGTGGQHTAADLLESAITRSNTQLDSLAERNEKIQETFESLIQKDDNFQNSLAGRALDILSRPMYAVSEGLTAARRASNEGQKGFFDTWDEALGGLAAGITGQKKTGFGEYIEEFKKSPTGFGGMLQELEEEHPEISKWAQRGLGFTGELLLDPLNAIGGGVTAVARQGGTRLTREGLEEAAEKIGRTAADDVFANVNLPASIKPGQTGRAAISGISGASAREAVDKAALEIMSGPNKGKLNVGRGTFANTVANTVANNVRGALLGKFEEKFNKFTDALTGRGAALTPRDVRNWISYDQNFKKFWGNIITEFNKTRPINPVNNINDVLTAMHKQSAGHIEDVLSRAAQRVRDDVEGPVGEVFDRVGKELTDFYYNAPSLRIGNISVPIKPVGRAYARVAKGLETNKFFPADLAKQMSYGKQFPGRLSQIGQTVRSRGIRAFDIEKGQIRKLFRNVTFEQGKRIQRALDTNTVMADPALEAVRLELKGRYERLFNESVANGARGRDGKGLTYVDDFAFIYNRGGNLKKRSQFKQARKDSINASRTTAGFRTEDAKKAGLRPVEHAGEAFLYYVMKHNRDMSKAWFLRDLIDHYGFVAANIGDAALQKRNLFKIPDSWVADDIKAAMPTERSQVYLPREMKEIYDNWEDLMNLSNDQLTSIKRNLQYITNKYKTVVTLPLPGFHIRNLAFDFMMGVMDGIPTRTWSEVLAKFAKSKTGASTSFTIAPGISRTYDELWNEFRTHAASGGFYSVDLPPATPFGRFKDIPSQLRHVAEAREDIGRFVHFLGALRQEAAEVVKRTPKKALDDAFNQAMEQAIYRVNHYKFDYGALTAFERQNLKLAFPFYTFARKSIPMMIEAMFLSPKLLARTYRFMSDPRQDSDTHIFNSVMVPAWMREVGYAQLTEEKEPWVIGGDVMPTTPLNTIDWPFNTGLDTNTTDFLQSVLQQVNPFINLPYEQTLGKRVFSNRDPGTLTDQILDMIAPYGALQDVVSTDRSMAEQILSSRLFTGMSTRKISEEEQAFAENELEDRTIDDPFRDFNYSQDKFRIYKSDNGARMIFRVKNLDTGKIVYESTDPNEALREAKDRAG